LVSGISFSEAGSCVLFSLPAYGGESLPPAADEHTDEEDALVTIAPPALTVSIQSLSTDQKMFNRVGFLVLLLYRLAQIAMLFAAVDPDPRNESKFLALMAVNTTFLVTLCLPFEGVLILGFLFTIRSMGLLLHLALEASHVSGGQGCSSPEHCVEEFISSAIVWTVQMMVAIVALQVQMCYAREKFAIIMLRFARPTSPSSSAVNLLAPMSSPRMSLFASGSTMSSSDKTL